MAKSLGISVTDLTPSLVPVETVEPLAEIMGLSLKNVTLTVVNTETSKSVYSDRARDGLQLFYPFVKHGSAAFGME